MLQCPYQQNRQPEQLVPKWKVGDRVLVEIEGSDYYGEIINLFADRAVISLDDGTEFTFDLGEMRPGDDEVELVDIGSNANCQILIVACGFVASNGGSICRYCIAGTAWNDAEIAPQLKPEDTTRTPSEAVAMALVQESPFFESLYRQDTLKGRLISGDCPLYQDLNPVNLSAAFIKYRTASGDRKAEDLLAEMLDRQLEKAEAKVAGADDEATVRDKIATLAEENGFMTPTEAAELRAG